MAILDFFKQFNHNNLEDNQLPPSAPLPQEQSLDIEPVQDETPSPLIIEPVQEQKPSSYNDITNYFKDYKPSLSENDVINYFKDYKPSLSEDDVKNYFQNKPLVSKEKQIPSKAMTPTATNISPLSEVSQTSSDYETMLANALKDRGQTNLTADMLRAGSMIGNAIAGTNIKGGEEFAKALASRANEPVSDVESQLSMEKHKISMGDEKSKRDPNSELSKAARELMAKMGMPQQENRSAYEIFQVAPILEKIISKQESLEAKREAKDEKKTLLTERNIDSFKARERDRVSKIAKDYNNVHGSVTQLENLLKNPSGYGDTLALFKLMRAADPGSTVRESEYKTAQNVGSLAEQISNRIQEVTSGKKLQENQRQELLAAVKKLKDGIKESTEDMLAPIKEDAKTLGVDEKYFLPTSLRSTSQPVQQSSQLKVGTIEDGHKYIGGDPSSPKSWKKVE